MQSTIFARPGDFACPDVQTIVLLAVDTEPFKVLLYPCPFGLLFLLGETGDFGMFLSIALENTRTHEKDCPRDGMHQCFRVIDDQAACLDAVSQPGDEMLSGWCRPDGRCCC